MNLKPFPGNCYVIVILRKWQHLVIKIPILYTGNDLKMLFKLKLLFRQLDLLNVYFKYFKISSFLPYALTEQRETRREIIEYFPVEIQ